jgi:hypothetical protein
MDRRLVGGYRRLLQNLNLDLLSSNIGLDENLAQELFEHFLKTRANILVAFDVNRANSMWELRCQCPFLFSMCCLAGTENWKNRNVHEQLHRRMYEQMRMTIGQALLASQLSLGDINAALIMAIVSCSPIKVSG